MQRSNICLSPRATLQLLDRLGDGHDSPVLTWTMNLLTRLQLFVREDQKRLHDVSINVDLGRFYN